MYDKTVTIFNKDEDVWRATVLHDVQLIEKTGQNASKDGNSSADTATLMIHITEEVRRKYTGPIAYEQSADKEELFTLRTGDFFAVGEYDGCINEILEPYSEYGGFYQYMKAKHDSVYNIVSVIQYDMIPHFEVGGM